MRLKKHQIYLIIGIFGMIILNATSFLENRQSQPEEAGSQTATYFSLESIGDVVELLFTFPRQVVGMISNHSVAQLQSFLRDGFFLQTAAPDPHETTLEADLAVFEQVNFNANEPLVYIFNSHPHEMIASTFADLTVGEMNITQLSQLMAELFEQHQIPVLVETACVSDILRENSWVFSQSFAASRILLEESIAQNPTLEFFFDLHRDGIPLEIARIDINETPYARVLFVIGTEHPDYQENYEIAKQLHEMLEAVRPGISRGVFMSNGPGRNGVYNQDIASTVQLIEIGSVETTIEEATNTTAILTAVIAEYIKTTTQAN